MVGKRSKRRGKNKPSTDGTFEGIKEPGPANSQEEIPDGKNNIGKVMCEVENNTSNGKETADADLKVTENGVAATGNGTEAIKDEEKATGNGIEAIKDEEKATGNGTEAIKDEEKATGDIIEAIKDEEKATGDIIEAIKDDVKTTGNGLFVCKDHIEGDKDDIKQTGCNMVTVVSTAVCTAVCTAVSTADSTAVSTAISRNNMDICEDFEQTQVISFTQQKLIPKFGKKRKALSLPTENKRMKSDNLTDSNLTHELNTHANSESKATKLIPTVSKSARDNHTSNVDVTSNVEEDISNDGKSISANSQNRIETNKTSISVEHPMKNLEDNHKIMDITCKPVNSDVDVCTNVEVSVTESEIRMKHVTDPSSTNAEDMLDHFWNSIQNKGQAAKTNSRVNLPWKPANIYEQISNVAVCVTEREIEQAEKIQDNKVEENIQISDDLRKHKELKKYLSKPEKTPLNAETSVKADINVKGLLEFISERPVGRSETGQVVANQSNEKPGKIKTEKARVCWKLDEESRLVKNDPTVAKTTYTLQAEVVREGMLHVPHLTVADVPHKTDADVLNQTDADVPHLTDADVHHQTYEEVHHLTEADVPNKKNADVPNPSSTNVPHQTDADVPNQKDADVPHLTDADAAISECVAELQAVTDLAEWTDSQLGQLEEDFVEEQPSTRSRPSQWSIRKTATAVPLTTTAWPSKANATKKVRDTGANLVKSIMKDVENLNNLVVRLRQQVGQFTENFSIAKK